MSKRQSEYLTSLLSDPPPPPAASGEPSPAQSAPEAPRPVRTTLLDRETALARIAAGEVKQITQLLLDPARVRIWPGNARIYRNLTVGSCRELIHSIVAEGRPQH